MVANRKVTGTAASMTKGLVTGGCISLLITLVGACIFAGMISKEVIQENKIGYCSMVVLLVSSMVGAAAAVGMIKHRRIYVCAFSGAIYYGLLLSVTALFFGGQYQGMDVTALLILAGCGAVALVGLKGEKRRNFRRRKITHR